MSEGARFAEAPKSLYPYFAAIFVALLLISNIGAVKLIELGPIITDGGAILFPLVYIVGDILSEVYGVKAARRVILTAFAVSILAATTFYLVQLAPPASDWENQEAFESILGFM
ncbi:MAG: queuosine precursor transporter, partial [Actinomycetota bacterium]